MKHKFWNWLDDADSGERTLMLCGLITDEDWFEDSVTPGKFRDELAKCDGDISVWINSPGGGVLAAAQIYNMLMEYPGNVRVRIDGIAASAATMIAMAGNTVEISPVGCMFVHNPEAMSIGNASDHKLTIEMLNEVKESIINAYEIKTGRTRKELSDLMDNTQWMCAQRAVNLGFADKIMYWDDESGSDVISNDVRAMLPRLAEAMDGFFEIQNSVKVNQPVSKESAKSVVQEPAPDNRVSADALMSRLNLITH